MPKTTHFEVNVHLVKKYLMDDNTDLDIKNTIFKPGNTLTMKYTHTQNYKSEDNATVKVTVVSVDCFFTMCCYHSSDEEDTNDDDSSSDCSDCLGEAIHGCVLKTEEPIYICIGAADLGRPITLYDGDVRVAKGYVEKILDKLERKPWDNK